MVLYAVWSGHMPTTSPITKIATGTSTKTIMQLQANASASFMVRRWGLSFDATSAAAPIQCELIETGSVGASTGTAYVSADIYPYNNAAAEAPILQLGTGASCFNPTTEGSITATRLADYQLIAPTNQYLYDWLLGNEFQVPAGKFLRVRVTAAATVNCIAYVVYDQ